MIAARLLSWTFRLEGIAVTAGGAFLLVYGTAMLIAVESGWMDLQIGSDFPKAMVFAVIGGAILAVAGLPLLLAASDVRRHPDGRPSAAVAVAIAYHVLLFAILLLALR